MPSTSAPPFIQFWCTDRTREAFLARLPRDDLRSLRLACRDFSVKAAPFLFSDLHVEFRSSTFTRPARMAALERIGRHVKTLTVRIPHSPDTFLPPLLDPVTGEEQTFVYTPQVHALQTAGSRSSVVPKYGTWEMTDLLTRQYPPLFHAATHVPSFIRAFRAMPALHHLTISCDGQAAGHRYRRSVVDYALISLRIAVEHAPLNQLAALSLLPVHPGALLYLRHTVGFGVSPQGPKRWAQIKRLTIHMDSFPFGGPPDQPPPPTDHLKLLHSYLQGFPNLTRFAFRWNGGAKGPCPLTLSSEPCLVADPKAKAGLRPLKLAHLRHMQVENVVLDASQVSSFILKHRRTAREFNYDETDLRTGTWDEALAPLSRISSNHGWKKKKKKKKKEEEREEAVAKGEVMEVPIMLSPVGMEMRPIRNAIWEEATRKAWMKQQQQQQHDNHHRRAYGDFQRATSRTRELLWCGPDHMKRMLRSSVLSWR
ncbi:hypothetical protein VTO42DRAFT_8725 [Malbranchea cinnamomea]